MTRPTLAAILTDFDREIARSPRFASVDRIHLEQVVQECRRLEERCERLEFDHANAVALGVPPEVSDPERCPYVHQDPETGRWYDAPHVWEPGCTHSPPACYEVCHYCGGRRA